MLDFEKSEINEEKIEEMREKLASEKFENDYIRELIAEQKGELNTNSDYYDGHIAEGNWSVAEDFYLEKLSKAKEDELKDYVELHVKKKEDEEEIDLRSIEFFYIFMPSYYAVKTLILYYCFDKINADKVYNLKNAVVKYDGKNFYGGLPFILKYIEWILKAREFFIGEGKSNEFDESIYSEIVNDFKSFLQTLSNRADGLEMNNANDDFINDILNCIMDSYAKTLKYEIRVEEMKRDKKFLLEYKEIDGYKILMHRDVKKDFKHLHVHEQKLANEKIDKTPRHPYNNFPNDSENLHGNLKGWFSQKVSDEGNKMVYKKDEKDKKVYIATVCGHYKYSTGRTLSLAAYK